MDALKNSKKISLLAVAILFLFTFFNLILDAPRTYKNLSQTEKIGKYLWNSSTKPKRSVVELQKRQPPSTALVSDSFNL
jgi:hypothetical protein